MLLKRLAVSFFAITACAQSTVPALLARITQDVTAFNQTLAAYKGDLDGMLPISEKSTALLNDIKNGTVGIAASKPLTFDEALSLAQSIQSLVQDTKQIIDFIIAQKPTFTKLVVVNNLVKTILADVRSAGQAFGKALVDKVPAEVQPVANKLLQELDDEFARGVKAYS